MSDFELVFLFLLSERMSSPNSMQNQTMTTTIYS